MKIVTDTAEKMNVSIHMLFDMWGCFETGAGQVEADRAYSKYYYENKISKSMENFCIDVLTGRIPLISLPLKAKKKGEK